jgi:hypothetical protein
MASTQQQQQQAQQQLVVSSASGKGRVMPTSSASTSGAGPNTVSGIVANASAHTSITMSVAPINNQANMDLANLFECPVCFDYALPPILQVC